MEVNLVATVCILGGRADSQLDLTRAYRNIVRFSPSLLATHIAASCFWGVGGAETKISATCCWTLPQHICYRRDGDEEEQQE